jgi:hypothetical protein
MSQPAASATGTNVNDITVGLAELDFNVSDEEISQARQIWLESSQSGVNYLQIQTVQHPMYANI